jgi:hypothetical protein
MAEAEHPHAQVSRRMAGRERLADERDLLADERDRVADERERLADERDRVADLLDQVTLDGATSATRPGPAGVGGSRLRLIESERGLESARTALTRSRALLARHRVAVGHEDNEARQQELTIAREMFASRVTAARPGDAGTPPVP